MKLVRYQKEGESQVAVVKTGGEEAVPVWVLGYEADDMTSLIEEVEGELPAGLQARADAAEGVKLADVKLEAPMKHPRQDVLCLGVNYLEHKKEVKENVVYDPTKSVTIFFGKRVYEAVDPGDPIDGHFDIVDSLDYEAELAVIIGKDARNVPLGGAEEYVFGYSILNDVSARTLQKQHQQWYFGKSLDGFTPIGPWIVTRDEFDWMPELGIRCYVNGEKRQDSNTGLLIKNIDQIIHEVTRGITLPAGTIIATGTPAGTGMGFDPHKFLKPGDVVRCEIDGIGVLENPVK